MPERRVGGQGLQQRQIRAGRCRPDRRLGVGHPDVDVQRAGRRPAQQPAQLGVDLVVARLVDVDDVAERPAGMDAGAETASRPPAGPGPQARDAATPSADADTGEANSTSAAYMSGCAVPAARDLQGVEHRRPCGRARASRGRRRQLLLDAERERGPAERAPRRALTRAGSHRASSPRPKP